MDTLLSLLARPGTALRSSPARRDEEGAWRPVSTQVSGQAFASAAGRAPEGEAVSRLREADRRARAANSPAARAQERLGEAERRLAQMRIAAQLAAASGDKEALERIIREAGSLAKQVSGAARGLALGGAATPVGEAVGRVRILLKQVKDVLDDADRAFADGPEAPEEHRRRRRLLQDARAEIGEGRLAAAELEAGGFHESGAAVAEPLDVVA